MRDRAGEFTELLCGLEWIAEQLMVGEQYGPGASVKAITERLSVYNDPLNYMQDWACDNADPDKMLEEINNWLRQ
jgi:hypothetical protein